MTLSEFMETIYLPPLIGTPQFYNFRSVAGRFIEAFGDLPIEEFPKVDFNAWRDAMLAEGKALTTIKNYLGKMRNVARRAAALGYCDPVPLTRTRKREVQIDSEEWIPQRLTWQDVNSETPLAIVWVSCFPPRSEQTDRLTRLAIKDFAEVLGRSPKVGDLTNANLLRLRERLVGLKQSRATIDRRTASYRAMQRALEHLGAETRAKPRTTRKPRGIRRVFGSRGFIDIGEQTEASLAWFLREYYYPLRLRTPHKNTVRNFNNTLRHFSSFLGRPAMLTDLDDLTVSRFLMARSQLGVAPRTVNCVRDRICALWNFAAKKKMVAEFPTVPPEKQPRRLTLCWTRDEMLRIVEAARGAKGRIGPIAACDWWMTLLHLIWCTGERITAIRQARWHWITGDGWIKIPAEVRKGQTGDIIRRLSADTLATLENIREPEREEVLPWPYTCCSLWRRLKTDLLIPAGLPSDRHSSFHRLRRTVASHFEAAGHSAKAVLDHSDARVTAKYLDPRIVVTAQPADVLFSLTEQKGGAA